jgi:hypothetical protein
MSRRIHESLILFCYSILRQSDIFWEGQDVRSVLLGVHRIFACGILGLRSGCDMSMWLMWPNIVLIVFWLAVLLLFEVTALRNAQLLY